MNTQISAICIANTQIREVNGLFSLADLHKASGGLKKHQPALWLRGSQTTDFIDELTTLQIRRVKEKQGVSEEAKQALLEDESSLRERIIKTVNGGNNRGTFVCKELVVHYGMWISPAFSIQVIQTFLNSKQAPQPEPQPVTVLPATPQDALAYVQGKDLGGILSDCFGARPAPQTAAPPRALLIDAADAVWDLYQLARHTEVIVETVQDFLAEDRPNMVTAHLSMLNDLVQKALNIDADTINSDLNRYLAA